MAKLKHKHDGEVEDPTRSPTPQASKESVASPISGTRGNSRRKGSDAETILQKAVCSVANRNAPGMHPSQATLSLPSLSDSHFLGVAAGSLIVLDSSFGSSRNMISLIRAKEVAQALLAEAIAKTNVEIQAKQVVDVH
jgi:hypothetical protein